VDLLLQQYDDEGDNDDDDEAETVESPAVTLAAADGRGGGLARL